MHERRPGEDAPTHGHGARDRVLDPKGDSGGVADAERAADQVCDAPHDAPWRAGGAARVEQVQITR